jgi:hypothetical protein
MLIQVTTEATAIVADDVDTAMNAATAICAPTNVIMAASSHQ